MSSLLLYTELSFADVGVVMLRYLLIGLLGLTLAVSTVNAHECDADDQCWYADPAGSGTVCSFQNPCTVETATGKLSAGDILYLLPGVYSQHYANYDLLAIINFDKFFQFQTPKPSQSSPVTVKSLVHQQAIIQGDYSQQCVVTDNDYIHFDGLVVRQCRTSGIRIYNDGSGNYDPDDGHYVHVRNSLIENIQGPDNMGGVYIGTARGTVIENNEFRGNVPVPATNGNCYSIVLFQSADVTIRDNYFHDTCGGIYFKHGERTTGLGGYTRIHGNTFANIGTTTLGKSGIWMNQNRAEIYDNLLLGVPIVIHPNVDGTQAPNSTDASIHHNTIVDSAIGLDHRRESPSVGALRPTVEHNVFYNSSYSIWQYGSDQEFTDGIGLVSNNNCFYSSAGDQVIDYFSGDGSFGNLGDSYSLNSFQTLLGFDQQSLQADPQFIDPPGGDYRLANTSACKTIDAGVRFAPPAPQPIDESLCFPVRTSGPVVLICL
ncbi:MAG: right-handed parallel beta-helix repeat-containing protein [Exilibacterium sp.]